MQVKALSKYIDVRADSAHYEQHRMYVMMAMHGHNMRKVADANQKVWLAWCFYWIRLYP